MRILKRLRSLSESKAVEFPPWMLDNLHYLTIVGSQAYHIATETSDLDITGFCLEPRECIVPSSYGYIPGFDEIPAFKNYQKHSLRDNDDDRTYDLSVYGLVNFFHLLSDGNPNIVEMLFTGRECVLHSSDLGEKVRSNRNLFLSKTFAFKCRMYAHSQLSKLSREPEGKRKALVDKFGWDTKYQSHIYRLMYQSEEVLKGNGLVLEKYAELLKAVRRGEIKPDDTRQWFTEKERELEKLETKSSLPQKPDRQLVKNLLVECIQSHYGNVWDVVPTVKLSGDVVAQLKELVGKL